mmetsp:Transcript_30724/g.67868  ORF Transcript_30724/g.67868 Transcript_30724/m.67868 type:complete len:249 (+) Transcript_30724:127-873(+)
MNTSGSTWFSTSRQAEITRFAICGETLVENTVPRTRFTSPSSVTWRGFKAPRTGGINSSTSPPPLGFAPLLRTFIVIPHMLKLSNRGNVTVLRTSTDMSNSSLVMPESTMFTGFLQKMARGRSPSMNHPMDLLSPQLCTSGLPAIPPPTSTPGLSLSVVPVSFISTWQPSEICSTRRKKLASKSCSPGASWSLWRIFSIFRGFLDRMEATMRSRNMQQPSNLRVGMVWLWLCCAVLLSLSVRCAASVR